MKHLLLALLLFFASSASHAQQYPTRTIRFVAPFSAGGGTDLIARKLAQKLSESLGQTVVVDNRTGASGVIGTALAANALPDGYTIMIATPTLTVNPGLIKNLPYDAIRDFAPVSLIATAPHLLAVHPSLPAKSVKELVALVRARRGELTYSAGRTGGSSHLSGELFNSVAGIRMVAVPYRGGGESMMAMVSGEVPIGFKDVPTTLPYMKTGRLRGLAVTSLKRSAAVPELPTIAESGYPGFQSGVWYGMLAPARTSPEITARLNAALVKIVRSADFVRSLAAEGAEPVASSPEYFGEFIRKETARWAEVIRESNITVN